MKKAAAIILLTLNLLYAYDSQCVELVKRTAKLYTNYPSTILAIAKAESSCGEQVLGDGKKSLGIMQIQVATLKWLATKDPTLRWVLRFSDKQLETQLLRSDEFSVMVACKLFEYHRKRHGYFGAISRYNGGTRNYKYYNKIRRIMQEQQ